MKKRILSTALLLFLTALLFAACRVAEYVPGSTPEPTPAEADDSVELDASASYASPPTLDITTLPASPPSLEMLSSDGVTSANVQAHYMVDEIPFASYHRFVDPEYPEAQEILFTTAATVHDFRFIEVHTDWGADTELSPGRVLYELDELTPEAPFVVTWVMFDTANIHRGISFVDEDGARRYFALHASGYDGELFLIELELA